MLHNDDGDGTFERGADPPLTRDGDPIGERFAVGKAAGNASVAAHDQQAATNVTVSRAAIDADGFLVLRGHDGAIAGVTPIDAGATRNVSVSLRPEFYNAQSSPFELDARLYHDDGDGQFDPATDTLVTAAEEPVGTHFEVSKQTDSVATSTPSVTSTPTGTPAPPEQTEATTATSATQTTGGSGPGMGVLAALLALLGGSLLAVPRRNR